MQQKAGTPQKIIGIPAIFFIVDNKNGNKRALGVLLVQVFGDMHRSRQ